jgi:tRNA G10  N-methylase Trm11
LRFKFDKDVKFSSEVNSEEAIQKHSAEAEEFSHALIELIGIQRKELHKLRKSKEYDHEVIRNMEAQFDLEEEKLKLQVAGRRPS